MLKIFIERPVLSTVISIILVILGLLSMNTLPVTQYPDIAPPTVNVSVGYPGANAETLLESVIIPIEEQINGVEGMTYMTSTASNNGSGEIQVYFEQGVDPDIASVNVQNRVSRANATLPQEVIRNGILVQKQQTSALMYFSMYSTNPEYDATFVDNYLSINVIPELQRIYGVGAARSFGGKTYMMRIWLEPDKLRAYNLVPSDVIEALNEQSQEAAAGSIGRNSGESFEYVITYKGRYTTEEEYENIILKTEENGRILRLRDVATVDFDAQTYASIININGYPGINVGVFQLPGSNAQEIIENIEAKLEELKQNFPEGVDYYVNYNTNTFLKASIAKVRMTLIEAFILVFLVVFVFLQDFKATIIPAIAVPVSIIGTFFFLNLFGYSINMLTLFALVLAIGIVVDDAIVVVEAVYAKIEGGAKSSKEATSTAMDEIAGAIVSITLVMAAVFVPVTFLTGPAGVFYQQFGVTLIVAIIISAVNALTLSPALCALFLKPQNGEVKKSGYLQRFYTAFNTAFDATTKKYTRSVSFLYRHKWITPVAILLSVGLIYWASTTTPSGFVPPEDRGIIFMNLELPPGASLDRTLQATNNLYDEIIKVPGVRGASMINGRNFFSGAGGSYALGFIPLEPWEERGEDSLSIEFITEKFTRLAKEIAPDAEVVFFQPPSIPGFGSSEGFDLQLLDRTGGSFTRLDEVATELSRTLSAKEPIAFAQNPFSTEFPQYELEVDVARAKQAGVTVNDILRSLQGYIGGIETTDFSRFGKLYRVKIQSLPQYRNTVESLNVMFVRNQDGEMAPINQFVTLNRVYGPQSVSRFNLFNAVNLTGSAAPGYSSGDAINIINEIAAQDLPQGFDIAFSGLTREEIAAGGQAITVFLLSLLFVYFLLAAQYESYIIPLAVIFSLPIGIMGAFLTTKFSGLENNIFFQIALIMLVGLLAKNAILIVEFGIQRRRQGMGIVDAAIDAAKVRLRPIVMTSFAFILGLTPLVLASGVGANGNRSIGTGAVGGLFAGTVLGVFVIPILYIFFQYLHEKVSGPPAAVKAAAKEQEA
jgi:hydrophobic/amphiphilic exporter-1 (mainly G- bacteria), HAE1 family